MSFSFGARKRTAIQQKALDAASNSKSGANRCLTNGEAVVPPGICDAECGRADRCMSRVRECGRLLMRESLTVLRIRSWKLTLQHGNAAAGRVDVGRDAQRTHAESAVFPGRAHRSADRHDAGRVHADGKEEVFPRVLSRCRSHRVLDDQGVDVKGPGHGCAAVRRTLRAQDDSCFLCEALGISKGAYV